MTGEPHRGLLSGADLAAWHPRLEEPLTYDYQRPDRVQDRPVGPGPGVPPAARAARRLRPGGHGPGQRGVHPHRDRMRASSRSPTGRPGTATPTSPTCRSKALLSGEYADARRQLVGPRGVRRAASRRPGGTGAPAAGLRQPARSTGNGDGGSVAPSLDVRAARAAAGPGHRRADDAHQRPGRTDASARATGRATPATSTWPTGSATWSPPRRAAAGCSPRRSSPALGFCLGTRAQMFTLTPGLPATLAPGKRPRTTLTPEPGAARRRAVPGVRHARRRPAGPVDAAVLPQPRDVRDEPAAGDRLPGVPLRATCRRRSTRARPSPACSTSSRGSAPA